MGDSYIRAVPVQAERDRNNSIMAALEEERTAAMAAAQRQVLNTNSALTLHRTTISLRKRYSAAIVENAVATADLYRLCRGRRKSPTAVLADRTWPADAQWPA